MKVGYNWLKEWVDIPVDVAGVARELTMVGLQLESMQPVDSDVYLDFEITVNRPDCLSVFGLAREIATIFGTESPSLPPLHSSAVIRVDGPEGRYAESEKKALRIQLKDAQVCPRYCGQIVRGVKVGSSPDWVVRKLQSAGVRSINNVVDVSNLVMLELGQPMHAFDYDKLSGGTIVVRKSRNEKLTMIDGKERLLDETMLVIADAERAQAVGGVMGGMDSEVTDSTQTVLLESAYFDPASIRVTAKRLELSTDASYRFERGVDFEMQAIACRRAAELLHQLAGGIPDAVLDVCAKRFDSPEIALRDSRVEAILGKRVDAGFIDRTLKSLGFTESDAHRWRVPSFRVDVSREIDLIEEIARHYGYNNFPDTLPAAAGKVQPDYPTYWLERRVGEFLRAAAFDETTTFSFVNPQSSQKSGESFHRVINPLSEVAAELRTSLLFNLVDAVEYNLRHRNENVRLFEIGRVFLKQEEKTMLGIVLLGDYQDLKGIVESMLPALQYPRPTVRSGTVRIANVDVGEMRQMEIDGRQVQAAQLCLSDLIVIPTMPLQYQPIIPFPHMQRDISFIVSESIPFVRFIEAIEQMQIQNLLSYELVDRYKGTNMLPGKVSLTFQLIYQSPDRTLTSEEVDAAHNRLIEEFSRRFSAELRK